MFLPNIHNKKESTNSVDLKYTLPKDIFDSESTLYIVKVNDCDRQLLTDNKWFYLHFQQNTDYIVKNKIY